MNQKTWDWMKLNTTEEKVEYLSTRTPDCSFIVGTDDNATQKFQCHKAVLSCGSSFFDRMFNGDFVESKTSQDIRLSDVEPKEFEMFINYLETKCLQNVSIANVVKLVVMAEKYLVSELKDECIRMIDTNLSTQNVSDAIDVFEYAFDSNNEMLITKITQVFQSRALLQNNLITCTNIYDLRPSNFYRLMNILSGQPNNIEALRFSMIEIYSKIYNDTKEVTEMFLPNVENVTDAKEVKDDKIELTIEDSKEVNVDVIINWSLNTIDFSKLTLSEFKNGPIKSKLLDFNRKTEILLKISK